MQRHRTDFVALFFGLAFLAGGSGFIVHQTTGHAVDGTWIAAVALVSIGCIFLGATLLRGPRPVTTTPAPASESPASPYASLPDEPTDAAIAVGDETVAESDGD